MVQAPRRTDPFPDRESVDWRAASVAVAIIAITILPAFLTGAQAKWIEGDTGIGLSGIGGFVGVLFTSSAVASAPTGRLVQRIGWANGIRLAASGTGSALALLAVIPDAWWGSWWPAALLFTVAGTAAATSQAASNQALVGSVPPGRYGLMFGLKHTAVPVAAMLGGLAVPTVALTIGWRWAFVIGSGLAAVVLLSVPIGRVAEGTDDAQPPRLVPTTPHSALVALAGAALLGHTAVDALGAFIVPFAIASGVADGPAGVLLTVGSLCGLATRLVSGWMVDSRQPAGLAWMASLFAIGATGIAILALGGGSLLIVGALIAFAGGWGWAGLLMFVVVRANPDAAATATGVVNTGKYIGAGLGPVLFGFLADEVSFSVAWAVAAAVLFAGSAAVIAIRLSPAGQGMAHPPGTSDATGPS